MLVFYSFVKKNALTPTTVIVCVSGTLKPRQPLRKKVNVDQTLTKTIFAFKELPRFKTRDRVNSGRRGKC